MKKKNHTRYVQDGIHFVIRYARYQKTQTRALLTPLDPRNGQPITKRQLYGVDSDRPVEATLYGSTRDNIYDNQVPGRAADLISDMYSAGIIKEAAEYHDMYALAVQYEHDIMTYYQHVRRWRDSTARGYRQQYRLMLPLLRGIQAENFDQAAYQAICDKILQTAATTRRYAPIDTKDVASSGQTRVFLLGLLMVYLQGIEGIDIPATPQAQLAKDSNRKRLLLQLDMAREYPADIIAAFCRSLSADSPADHLIIGILMDTGLRIAEALGLLFGSIQQITGAQGAQYYLMVTGQIDGAGKRTNLVKKKASYRYVPLSLELGKLLWQRRTALARFDTRIDKRLFLSQVVEGKVVDDPDVVQQMQRRVADALRTYLVDTHAFDRLVELRPYTFDRSLQDQQLKGNMSHHSLRRNFCTDLYANGGWLQYQIDRQMGHDNGIPARGLTQQELYDLCLRKQVVTTPFHDQQPLNVTPGETNPTVPVTRLRISIPPHTSVTVAWSDPTPGNVVLPTGECECTKVEKVPLPQGFPYPDSLLLNDEYFKIERIEQAYI